MNMDLTDEEIIVVQTHRGRRETGYPIHEVRDRGDRVVGYYFWPMGFQPSGAARDLVAGISPEAAARLFLEKYEKNPLPGRDTTPIPKKPACSTCGAEVCPTCGRAK